MYFFDSEQEFEELPIWRGFQNSRMPVTPASSPGSKPSSRYMPQVERDISRSRFSGSVPSHALGHRGPDALTERTQLYSQADENNADHEGIAGDHQNQSKGAGAGARDK